MKKMFIQAWVCLLISVSVNAQSVVEELKSNPEYLVTDSILIRTADGASVSAWVVRKKDMSTPQATILQFTIYARQTDILKMKDAADHGYIGMMAYSRGKRYSDDEVAPYEYEGRDCYDVIEWITQQPWSNKQVGMRGGSYNGFTQWAATKKLHPALKTIVTSASVAPGLDVPMTNNVSMSFIFPWIYYVSNNKFLDEDDYRGSQWEEGYRKWFSQGASYRSLDTVIGRPGTKVFHRWLDHPTYDAYWQSMVPYQHEFANIDIPILSTTGYYDGGQIGEMYYYREHLKYKPNADHYLIIGPYGHFGSQGKPDSIYSGYRIDPVANISIHGITYEWFDHIFKGSPKPSFLKNKVNYQVMGTNEWKHAASLDKMYNKALKLYITSADQGEGKLSLKQAGKAKPLELQIDFNDRTSVNSYYYFNQVVYDHLNINNGILLISDPLQDDTEVSGRFTGEIKAIINKKDMDFSLALFEILPDSSYFLLSYFMGRASYAKDIHKRTLLKPGKKESIPFSNSYMTSRMLRKGSRIAVVLNVNKSAFEQINYGTGGDVSSETIKDAGEPLRIKWLPDSYISLPVFK
ncbi:CocE/NonD family hydrolase [Terrimonas sp. NA20]|uniref:CocE/NonD family hydrolase n=1 Tax=Terrimonas ginsenosidimutans TaxID=2908004 RepID=A0ABS9KXQ0_9BACT|nr:CocE/NonD family hydrolase [Terrimonas ginsenosidimutans]MCG2617073.1 CocE/NonD family hydrolase [Terrimonas ginsenosidimutans]